MSTLSASGIYIPESTDHARIWEHFSSLVATLDARPKGLAGFAQRVTNSTGTTTEVGVLRLDSIAVKSGRAYRIATSNLVHDSTLSNEVVQAKLRLATGGGAATTASTVIGNVRPTRLVSTAEEPITGGINCIYQPGADTTVSVLLTVARFTALGGTVNLIGAATTPIEITIEDIGAAVADTGVDI